MKKRLWQASVLFVLLAGFAVMSFGAPATQSPAQKYKITLENGKIIEGEIVAQTATTISIKDANLGVIAIARENILKIDPPLAGTKPASVMPPPVSAPRAASEPYAQPMNGAGNIQFGFSLSGGLSMINGGDFNQYIQDFNTFALDYNDYYGADYYAVDWNEIKSMPFFGGEVFARFGKHFGIGLGVEYMKKTNPGNINYLEEDAWRTPWYGVGYYDASIVIQEDINYSQALSVIPITLSFYGFLPVGQNFEAYAKAGVGYYLGKLTTEISDLYSVTYNERWYFNDGTAWPPHYDYESLDEYNYLFDVTCNTLGFHFGAGFNYNVSNNISIFGEAFYRMANLKDWQGDGSLDYNYRVEDQWTDEPSPTVETGSSTDSWIGKLWSFDDIWDFLNTGSYLQYWLYEAGDEPSNDIFTDNVRATEINFNGLNFKVGVKISFGGRR